MRSFASRARPAMALVVMGLLFCTAALAADDPLELTLGGSYQDTEGIGQAAAVSGAGLAKLGPGLAGPVIEFRYTDPEHGRSTTGTGFGAAYELGIGKWKLQPFVGIRYLYWTGDMDADHSGRLYGGIKTAGEGAFLKVDAGRERVFGGAGDSNSVVVSIGFRV